ncbi:DUF3489 domain-containing protein [Erythrobacter ramosus]|uniref:DUF3489 domain-containing protein n=1 Tax=Erythrobacter ramosus TaxID=35811 RepID=UPI0031DB5733
MARTAKTISTLTITDTSPPRPHKIDAVVELMRRAEGASLGEITEATGWLPHSARAAFTGLRKKGYVLEKTKRGDATCYRVVEATPLPL